MPIVEFVRGKKRCFEGGMRVGSSNRSWSSRAIMEVQAQQKEQKAIERNQLIYKSGAYPGCYVRMKHGNTLRTIRMIASDGHVYLEGARVKCSPADFVVILLLLPPKCEGGLVR